MNWIGQHDWLLWVALAFALAAVEVASLTFILIMLAGGAVVGAILAAVGAPVAVQVLAAIAASALLLIAVRPLAVRRLRRPGDDVVGLQQRVGATAIVVETVSALDGRVRLRGEVWSARLATGSRSAPDSGHTTTATPGATSRTSRVILPGESVTVVAIDGATAVVSAPASEGNPA